MATPDTPERTLHEGDFMRLLMLHEPALRAFARSLLPDWYLVDEVIQEASVTLWQKFAQLRDEPGFLPWAKVVVRFKCLSAIGKLSRDRHVFSDGVLVHDPVDPSPAPDAAAELAEKTRFVNQAITRLPADMREALLLFTVEQMSHAEIATVQRCSAKAVEVRVYRARQMLREMLDAGRM